MRQILPFTRGIAILGLSASVFLGCQDFLSEDKSVQTAKTASEEQVQVVAQEDASKDVVVAEPAKDLPATAAEIPKPVASEPVSTPAVPAAVEIPAECKDIYAQMQTALQTPNDPLYMELKNKFGSLNCDLTQAAGPTVPAPTPDSATVCNNFKSSLAQMDPNSTKYPLYLEQIAIHCTANP